jgi:hypothetical protein
MGTRVGLYEKTGKDVRKAGSKRHFFYKDSKS